MKLEPGVAFVSFPYFQSSDSGLIANNSAITKVMQKDSITSVNSTSSYFLYVKEATELTWKKSEEPKYNSALLNDGMNFVALYKGSDPLMIGEMKVNGQALKNVLEEQQGLIRAFYVFDSNGGFHNLAKEPFLDFQIFFGSGALIDVNGFAKLSWTNSKIIQKQVDAAIQADALAQKKNQQTQEKEQEKYIKQVQKQFEKMNEELSQKIFKETQNLPKQFFQVLKGGLEEQNKFFADVQLLAQIHPSNEVYQYAEEIVPIFWEEKQEWQRPFMPLSSPGLNDVNSSNRSFVFIEFPYKTEEIDPKTGIMSLFRGLAFVRAKDCSWKFDPIGTMKMENLLKPYDLTLYDEKILVKTLKTLKIPLTENDDFTASRLSCQPQVSSTLRTRGKLIDINTEAVQSAAQSDIKILKDHEKNCISFGKIINNLYPASLQEFIYHSENEPKITGANFPQLSFDQDTCVSQWPNLLKDDNLNKILNDNYTRQDGNTAALDALKTLITDDSIFVFLGTNKYFTCSGIEDSTKKDYCLFGTALSKMAPASCKKISSDSVQAFCAGAIAQNKKSPAICDKVYGAYDESKDPAEKLIKIRNCQLDALSVSAKTTSDCKSLKKTKFFFFHLSTPSFDLCKEYATKAKKLTH